MAEEKRIFNAGKMNRDLDDRLVPAGEYRDALNVNIGRSEGSDVGALENLKGNEVIPGQDMITGTAIGHVRDQTNNRIYWFTTSADEDAIHEYDETAQTVTTLIREPKTREAALPTCAPELQSRITDPEGSTGTRPPAPDLPSPPRGTCMVVGDINHDASGDFSDPSQCGGVPSGACGNPMFVEFVDGIDTNPLLTRDDSLCVTPISSGSDFTCAIAGSGSHGITVAQDGTVSNPNGLSFVFDNGDPVDNSAPGATAISHQITITYTIPAQTPPYDNAGDGTIECVETVTQPGADPLPDPITFSVTELTGISGTNVTGTDVGTIEVVFAETGQPPITVSAPMGILLDSGRQWAGSSQTNPDGLTLTSNDQANFPAPTISGTTAIFTTTATASGTAQFTWGGATTEVIPGPDLVFANVVAQSSGFQFTINDRNNVRPFLWSGSTGTLDISGGTTTFFGRDVDFSGTSVFVAGVGAGGTQPYLFTISYADLGYPSATSSDWAGINMTLPQFEVNNASNNYNVEGGTHSIG